MTIHPTALVDAQAKLGRDVTIGPFTIVHGNVEIGDGSVIESHCEIGHPTPLADGSRLSIGAASVIRSHSVFYEGSNFGEGLKTGHRVIVREGTRAGRGLQIGVGSEIQGDCTIGDHTRMQSDVLIGKVSRIGSFVWMFPRSGMLNDPMPPSNILNGAQIDSYAVIGAYSFLMPGVTVGEGAFVGVCTTVSRAVAPHRIVCGDPMVDKGSTERLRLPGSRLPARPWTRHFHRGYPEEVIRGWISEAQTLTSHLSGGEAAAGTWQENKTAR